jgi:hypothetical protein
MTCDGIFKSKFTSHEKTNNRRISTVPINVWSLEQLVNNLLCNFDDDLLFLMRRDKH